ncbi:hypothetical protein Q1695_009795 [Nippostrongylus brasiliensis]|nr:hypothetical protein Q1695_009795 [Nippostrongylus brasiliensis]
MFGAKRLAAFHYRTMAVNSPCFPPFPPYTRTNKANRKNVNETRLDRVAPSHALTPTLKRTLIVSRFEFTAGMNLAPCSGTEL